jgi:hypothetical protein
MLKKFKTYKMKKEEKIELELMAILLWWEKFGKTGLSEEKHRLYMCERLDELNKLKEKLQKK